MIRVKAARYENSDTNAALLEYFPTVEDVSLRWELPGGLRRLEVTVKSNNHIGRYQRYDLHAGQRLAVYTGWAYRPISGWITTVKILPGNRIKYICYGAWYRLFDRLDTTTYAEDDTNDEVIETVLTDHVTVDDGNFSNIAASGTAVAGWQPDDETGSYPGDIIPIMADMGSSGNVKHEFWFIDQPFDGPNLQQFTPYFKPRSSSSSVDWRVFISDLQRFEPARDISDLRNSVKIYYGRVGGDASSANAAGTQLTDSTASFVTDGVLEGDAIYNETDGSSARITSVAATVLQHSGLSGGTGDDWAVGDVYAVHLQDLQLASASGGSSPYVREYAEKVADFNETQAQQYADELAARLNVATQRGEFLIASPYVFNNNMARTPLIEMIASGGGYLQIMDLGAQSSYAASLDDRTSFFITSLTYNLRQNQMRVTLDNEDGRLDARLVRAGIIGNTGTFV